MEHARALLVTHRHPAWAAADARAGWCWRTPRRIWAAVDDLAQCCLERSRATPAGGSMRAGF
jgi:hypothetical protein